MQQVRATFGADQQSSVLNTLSTYIGGGSGWEPSQATITTDLNPDAVAHWNAMPATVQNAVTQSEEIVQQL